MKNIPAYRLFIICCCILLISLSKPLAVKAQSNFLIGKWHSVNKKDSLNLNFINSHEVNIDAMEKLKNQKFSYHVDTLKKQLILVMHPEGSNFQLKLLLWKISNEEMKLQGVDFQNFDNPLLDIPKANERNTFVLRKIGN
jgi:hypothetical protein